MDWRREWESLRDEWPVLTWFIALPLASWAFASTESWYLKPIGPAAYVAWVIWTFPYTQR